MNCLKVLIVAATAFAAAQATSQVVPDQPVQLELGPGIAVAGSADEAQLPEEARRFINIYFPGTTVTKCEKFYAKGTYEVELNSGVDIDFDSDGKVLEADAPFGVFLPKELVKFLLHPKAYDRLAGEGYEDRVKSIEFKKGKAVAVDVDRPDPDTYIFDLNGFLLLMKE